MINTFRRFIQTAITFINNSYFGFIFTGKIYQGSLKSFCAPGLNCYSCPASIWACPIGALQSLFATIRVSLQSLKFHIGLYIIGFMGMLGMIAGRFPCGWLCPFGFLQELVYKIPTKKINLPSCTQYGKYFFLLTFVVILPLAIVDEFGYGSTWFCKFICPAGTLEAGIPMIIIDPSLRRLIGMLFYNKLIILSVIILSMVFIRRPFCRTICPLGGFYSLFNKFSIVRMRHDENKCVRCNECFKDCPMHLKFYEGANQLNCIRCFKCYDTSCKYGAISIEIIGKDKTQIIKENLV
ncbi:MAG: 4Fe-4S binding protein [Proteobacteria bacterium]|nr:4Fe-4S binding protein [Pseudomonadota bacterium]